MRFSLVNPNLLRSETGVMKLGSDESFYNLMIYEAFTDLSVAIKRDLQRYCRP